MSKVGIAAFAAALIVTASPAFTQGFPVPKLIAPVKTPGEFPLYPAGQFKPPESASTERWNAMGSDTVVRNVVVPTITPFLPDPAKASGAAVLVTPGGGFMLLSIKNEGWDVARWFADHGVAAFVLKYRVKPTPEDEAAFDRMGREVMANAFRHSAGTPAPPPPTFQPAVDDGIAALKLLHARAAEWHIDPARIGMIGFSAGAMETLAVTQADQDGARPAFIGMIYGPMTATAVPASAPPLFTALAADDPLFGSSGMGIVDSWRKANRPVEFHLYQKGGHGFGMLANGTTTPLWPDEFLAWMRLNGFIATPSR